jgi:3-oxoacyl-[acyl-carrier-protein] synthase III
MPGERFIMNESPLWRRSGLRIRGYGHHYPRTLVENDTAEDVGTNPVDAAVIGRIDVRSRYVAQDDETPILMGAAAASNALADAGIHPDDVDLVVMSNWTDRQFVPELAPRTAEALGARKALAFDVCGACTGFVHGVQTAASMLSTTPHWSTAVIVSAERFSRRVRPESKGQLIVGDAAGAVVLTKSDADGDAAPGLIDSVLFSDGARWDATTVLPPEGWIRSRKDLLETAVASQSEVVVKLLKRSGLDISDIDWVVPHPGTGALHRAVREALGIPEERFVTNYEVRGNTGSAAIPIVLSEMRADGRLADGDRVLTPAVGAGWFYGGLLFHV